jgi:hypothetical protein
MSTRARSRNHTLLDTSVSSASASSKVLNAAGMSPAKNSAYPRLCRALNSSCTRPNSAPMWAHVERSVRAARRSCRRRWIAPRLSRMVARSSGSRWASKRTEASKCRTESSSLPLRNAMSPLNS